MNIHGGNIYKYINKMTDFSANINPIGLPESVKTAIVQNINNFENYPDPNCQDLIKSISNYENVQKSQIVCGNGAADLIYKIVLYNKPKKAIVLAPTFLEYEKALKLCDCDIIYHYLKPENDFAVQLDILEKLTPEINIVFICNPNNPTGVVTNKQLILEIAKKTLKNNTILVIDECFNDFIINSEDYTVKQHLNEFDNIIILKAFTKIYAMAGIRLGYGLCSNPLQIQNINDILQPWSVSTVASVAGIAALQEQEYVQKTKELININREFLINSLKDMGFVVYNSVANYAFFKCDIYDLDKKLEDYNILIRSCENYIGLGVGYFRIAVKSEQDNKRLLECIKKCTQI